MKIAAKISDSRVLVEMSSDELARIIGYSSDYTLKKADSNALSVGKEYDIDERFSNINDLASLPKTITDLKKQLDNAMKTMERAEKAVAQTTFNPIAKKKD